MYSNSLEREMEFIMSEHPETFEEFFNDQAYKKAQAENDAYRQCLIEVQKRTRNRWIKKLISAFLQGNKKAVNKLLAGNESSTPFLSESHLLGESQLYNADIEYGEAFQRAWMSLSREERRHVRENIDEIMTEGLVIALQGQHERVKYTHVSGYPRKTIKSVTKEGLCYYWSPVVIRKGQRVIYMLDITNDK